MGREDGGWNNVNGWSSSYVNPIASITTGGQTTQVVGMHVLEGQGPLATGCAPDSLVQFSTLVSFPRLSAFCHSIQFHSILLRSSMSQYWFEFSG